MADPAQTTAVLKAISDPIRWEIVRQMTEVDELAAQALEKSLPVSKPTISYHIRILAQAGLVTIRKEGRYLHYTLQRQVLRDLVRELWILAPDAAPRQDPEGRQSSRGEQAASLMTW